VDVIEIWTGRHANALLKALRLTNESFANRLGVAVRTVAKWNANPDMELSPEMQQVLDTFLLREVSDDGKARFSLFVEKWQTTKQIRSHSTLSSIDEFSSLTSPINESDSLKDTIEQIEKATLSLANAHLHAPAKRILSEVLRLQRQTHAILRNEKLRFRETRNLLRINSDLLAHGCILLGDLNEDTRAEQYGLAALMFAGEAEVSEEYAWYARSKTARWQDKYVEAADFAQQGYDRSSPTPMRTQLAWYEASAAALLGDRHRAKQAAQRAEEAAEKWLTTDTNLSVWSFPRERQAVFAQSVAIRTGDAQGVLTATAMADASWASGGPKAPATWAQVRVGAGIAHLMNGSLEGAVEEVTPMLSLDPQFRMATVTRHLANLDRQLRQPRFKDSPAARELRDAIREFNSGALGEDNDSTEEE
jgi:uncharacterized protein YheU (UPF0270 family)